MSTKAQINILMILGLVIGAAGFLQKPLGLNDWVAAFCPVVMAACIWGAIWVQRRAKRRGEQIPHATPKQLNSRTRLMIVIIVVTTLSGPFWLPYQGIHLSFWALVGTSTASCVAGLFALWLGLRFRRKI
jgi:Na+/H+ antiporter NhaD/arsenite permease-like protein